jgi:hypothetical protein
VQRKTSAHNTEQQHVGFESISAKINTPLAQILLSVNLGLKTMWL